MKFVVLSVCGWILSSWALCAQTLDAFNPNPDSGVAIVAIQPDGRILLGGGFLQMGKLAREAIARVNTNGSVDATFNPGTWGSVSCLAVQTNGQIVVGGFFTSLGGQACTNIGRLNADGTVDQSFSSYANSSILSVLVQTDGRILVAGGFTNLAGQSCNRIGRLNTDGTLDTNFNASANGTVTTMALQMDGKILVGGSFTNLDGTAANYIGRLNTDGSLDSTFSSSASANVTCIAVQTNNMILVGGIFTNLAGALRSHIGRLNSDGSIDAIFNPGASNNVLSIVLQADGQIIVGGVFTGLAGAVRDYIGRLNSNGTLDGTFNPGASANVSSLALQSDGGILVCGQFTNLDGGSRSYIGRLVNNDIASQSLTFTSTSATWMRGGSSPEVWRTSFEVSTDGMNWTYLGDGTRISGGWQVSGLSIPTNASLCAQGFVNVSGYVSGSSSLLQSIAGVPVITSQPIGVQSVPKTNVTFTVVVGGSLPLAYQWQLNGTNLSNSVKISGATNTSLVLSNLVSSSGGAYCVAITNSYGSVTSQVALLTMVNPTTNDSFTAGLGSVYATAVQNNGEVVFGGEIFTSIGGQSYYGIGRANTNGSLDTSFDPNLGEPVNALVVQEDGRIVVSGSTFKRLNSDGTVDTSFTNTSGNTIYSIVMQPDGKFLVAGSFVRFGSQPYSYIARVNTNGIMDTGFNAQANATIYSMALQTNGQIVVGGSFTNLDGSQCNYIGRLNADGTLDTNFNASANRSVYCLAVQQDGKILAGGSFSELQGQWWDYLGRLNPDGSLDTTFSPYLNNYVYSIALQSDGKILIGGSFTSLSGYTPANLNFARLNSDGTMDSTFVCGASSTVNSLAVQPDGKVLVGGNFGNLFDSTFLGPGRNGIGRLKNTQPASQSLALNGSTITLQQTGPSPAYSWVAFDSSLDGTNWTSIGTGAYTTNGWQMTGVTLPASSFIRSRACTVGGEYDGSGWISEYMIGPPSIATQPANVTVNAGTSATFGVSASGTSPFTYQWMKNGAILTNSANISGAQSQTLVLKNVLGGNDGNYSVIVSNLFGTVTSGIASLNVIDPAQYNSSGGFIIDADLPLTLNAYFAGTPPFYYQWLQSGIPLADQTNYSLIVTNLVFSDSGLYAVVVSNAFGIETNTIGYLNVNMASPDTNFNPGANSFVYAFAVQPDGKIIVGGSFTNLAGQTCNGIARLNSDGSLDNTFNSGISNANVDCVSIQTDGKILVGGNFSTMGGQPRNCIGRFNPDGSVDSGFHPDANFGVNAIVIQADDRILVGGDFSTLAGQACLSLGRLDTNGILDTSFNTILSTPVYTVGIQPDGRIIAGGYSVERLNQDGSTDTNFNVTVNNSVSCVLVQPNGKIILSGYFTRLDGTSRNYIGRVNTDGTLDTNFNPGANSYVYCLALQTDGKILVGGLFGTLSGESRNCIGRLNPDGSLDAEFDPMLSNGAIVPSISAIALQTNGDVLLGGGFTTLGSQYASYNDLARLDASEAATESLSAVGSGVTWERGVTSPEVWWSTFDVSTNGTDWTSLGAGTRVAGGWQLAPVSLPTNAIVRARGPESGGENSGSSWFAEDIVNVNPNSSPELNKTDGNFGLTTSGFGFDIDALIGQTIIVESSTDLSNWDPLYTNSVTSSPFYFLDPNPVTGAKYYRARLQ